MKAVFDNLARRKFADLTGATVRAAIPVREAVINGFLNTEIAARGGRAKQFHIRVLEGNRLQAGVLVSIGPFTKWLRPEVAVDPAGLWSGSPGILLTFAGGHYGAVVKLIETFAKGTLPAGVHIGNGQVALDLGKLPQTARFRSYFELLKRVQFSSRSGVMWIEMEVAV